MSYLTPTELAASIDATELAQLATPLSFGRAISGAKMSAIIAGTLPSGDPDYPAAVAALATIVQVIANRSGYVDGFLVGQYAPVPIPDIYVPAVIKQIMVALVRYDLAKDAATQNVRDRYLDAIANLERIQSGDFGLNLPPASGVLGGGPLIASGGDQVYTKASTRFYQSQWSNLP